MSINYNNFAKTFSNSRKNMKWEEIDYFLSFLENKNNENIADIGCWNGRLLKFLKEKNINFNKYLWIDLSEWLLEEAKKIHKDWDFLKLNMLDLEKIDKKLDIIFLIASFHHLDFLKDRLKVLTNVYKMLKKWWKVFMTNWALDSNLNKEKYKNSIVENSKNEFWGYDYNIKIGKYTRYYHCFSLDELDYLFKKTWFKIVENRLFNNQKNYISILEK